MNTQRLTILADYLSALSATAVTDRAREFNLHSWVTGYAESNACGTSACAVGEACCNIPVFQAEGLSLTSHVYSVTLVPLYERNGESSRGWQAVEDFFEVSADIAEKLFQHEYYLPSNSTESVDPATVAARIRAFLAGDDLSSVNIHADLPYGDDEDDDSPHFSDNDDGTFDDSSSEAGYKLIDSSFL